MQSPNWWPNIIFTAPLQHGLPWPLWPCPFSLGTALLISASCLRQLPLLWTLSLSALIPDSLSRLTKGGPLASQSTPLLYFPSVNHFLPWSAHERRLLILSVLPSFSWIVKSSKVRIAYIFAVFQKEAHSLHGGCSNSSSQEANLGNQPILRAHPLQNTSLIVSASLFPQEHHRWKCKWAVLRKTWSILILMNIITGCLLTWLGEASCSCGAIIAGI